MLEVKNLQVSYGAINALQGISLSVNAGKIVTLIGSNGAGKSTTLRAISGLVKPRAGEILYNGKNIAGLPAHQIVRIGLSQVPEGRMVFANLTVQEKPDDGRVSAERPGGDSQRIGRCVSDVSALERT
jgi:branched-chain amino acid transport system ATP-binding protein